MNAELSEYLLGLDKYFVIDGVKKENHEIEIRYPLQVRIYLMAPDDFEQNFFIDLWESEKKALKVTLHHQDDNTQHGLLRIDYNGRHKNPVEITDSLPEKFHPYAGKFLDEYAGHIHYVVDGYKALAWAIPLEFDDYPVKKLDSRTDYHATLKAFFDKINVKTIVTFNTQMRVL